MLKQKNIVVCLLLSILTCGIYMIIWYIQLTNNMGYMSKNRDFSGITVIFLTIITCGIYKIYWNYKMGKLLYEQNLQYNFITKNNAVLYLILSIIGWDLINFCIMQSELNDLIEMEITSE